MSSSFKKIWNIITSIIVALVVVLALLLAGPRLIGMRAFTVLSGSMEPTYHTGSIIYVKPVDDPRNVPDGTPITYMASEDTIVTHRVVGAVPDEEDPSVVRYRTKGDANDNEDGMLVHYKNIIGTPVFTIPKLGYFANYIQQPPGLYLGISFGAMLVLMMFLPELIAVFKDEDTVEEPKPVKEPKPKRVKAPKAPKPPKPEKLAKPRREKPARPEKRPAPELEEPEYVAPAPVYKPEPEVVRPQPVQVYEPVEEEPVVRRGSHELKEPSRRASTPKPAKRKGGAHVIEKPRKR